MSNDSLSQALAMLSVSTVRHEKLLDEVNGFMRSRPVSQNPQTYADTDQAHLLED